MFLYLLFVGFCACDELTFGNDYPYYLPYYETRNQLHVTEQSLEENLFSMRRNIPNLDDRRRHFTEILYVVYDVAAHSCGPLSSVSAIYYQQSVNASAPFGIANPEGVINTALNLVTIFNEKTSLLQLLIKDICTKSITPLMCDEMITNIVANSGRLLKKQSEIYLAAGWAAQEYTKKALEFLAASKEHNAHQYVIEGGAKIRGLVSKLRDVLKLLNMCRWVSTTC